MASQSQPARDWKKGIVHWAIVLAILLVPGVLLGGLYVWTNTAHPKQIWDVILRQSVDHLNEVAPPDAAVRAPNVRLYEERLLASQVHCTGPVTWSVERHRALSASCPTAEGRRWATHRLNGQTGFAWYQVERSGQTNLLLVDEKGNILAQEPLQILPGYTGKSIGGDDGE